MDICVQFNGWADCEACCGPCSSCTTMEAISTTPPHDEDNCNSRAASVCGASTTGGGPTNYDTQQEYNPYDQFSNTGGEGGCAHDGDCHKGQSCVNNVCVDGGIKRPPMKRTVQLRESELVNLIERVINEQTTPCKQINGSPCAPNSMSLMTPLNTCVTINGVPANNSHVGQVVVNPISPTSLPFEITNVTNITATAVQPTTTVDFITTNQPCTTNPNQGGGCAPNQMCQKDCSELVPSSFTTLIANKPCNWLTNRMTAFLNKMSNMSDPCNCQHKRVQCKLNMVKQLVVQNGC